MVSNTYVLRSVERIKFTAAPTGPVQQFGSVCFIKDYVCAIYICAIFGLLNPQLFFCVCVFMCRIGSLRLPVMLTDSISLLGSRDSMS